MQWNVAGMREDDMLVFYWYDAQVQDWVITEIADVFSPRLTRDDKREPLVDTSDILLFYLVVVDEENGLVDLRYRQQRERYGVERTLASFSNVLRIGRVGMSGKDRVQIELIFPEGEEPDA